MLCKETIEIDYIESFCASQLFGTIEPDA